MEFNRIEGFNTYSDTSQLVQGDVFRSCTASNAQIIAGGGRFGGNALALTAGGIAALLQVPDYTGSRVGFYVKTSARTEATPIFRTHAQTDPTSLGVSYCLEVSVTADLKIRAVYKNGIGNSTTESSILAGVEPDKWFYIEIGGTEPRLSVAPVKADIVVDVNGVNVITAIGVANYAGLNPYHCLLGGEAGQAATEFSDLYVTMGAGEYDVDYLPKGPCRVFTFTPDSAGSKNDWAGDTSAFGEGLTPPLGDGDGSVITSNTVGAQAQFNVPNFVQVPVSVYAVQTQIAASKLAAGEPAVISQYVDSAGTLLRTSIHAHETEGVYKVYTSELMQTDPNTAADWTAAAINVLQVGVEVNP